MSSRRVAFDLWSAPGYDVDRTGDTAAARNTMVSAVGSAAKRHAAHGEISPAVRAWHAQPRSGLELVVIGEVSLHEHALQLSRIEVAAGDDEHIIDGG